MTEHTDGYASMVHDAVSRGDILLEIFCRLSRLPDLAACACVCRAWHGAAADDRPWRHVYLQRFGAPEAWEACGSYRDQLRRAAGLRGPQPAAPPPHNSSSARDVTPCPLELYDTRLGIRTTALSYDPVTGLLLRAVGSVPLFGDGVHMAIEGVPLKPHTAAQSPDQQQQQQQEEEQQEEEDQAIKQQMGLTTEVGQEGAGPGADRAPGMAGRALRVVLQRMVCWVTPDGSPPKPPTAYLTKTRAAAAAAAAASTSAMSAPVTAAAAAAAAGEAEPGLEGEEQEDGGVPSAIEEAPAAATAADGAFLTPEQEHQLQGLNALLPSVMCAAGGYLYLPAGPTGRGLAVWDLAAAGTTRGTAPTSNSRHGGSGGLGERTSGGAARTSASAGGLATTEADAPYWLISEAHPGRLLAAAADGALAASGCDGGVLALWRAADRTRLGSGDIRHLTALPVVHTTPTHRPGSSAQNRHHLRIAVSEASGLAAVMLSSPLSPATYLYRAAPERASSAAASPGHSALPGKPGTSTNTSSSAAGAAAGGVVGQLLCVVDSSAVDGLALFRGHLVTMGVLSNDVIEARFGGSGGSCIRITVNVNAWPLWPHRRDAGAGVEGSGTDAGCGAGAADDCVVDPEHVTRGFSSRVQLEHPRTLALGRMRPQLTPSEDLLLLTLPRDVGGRPPHHRLACLQHAFGPEGEEEEEEEEVQEGDQQEEVGDQKVSGGSNVEQGRDGRDGQEADGKGRAAARGAGGRRGKGVRGSRPGAFVVVSEEDRLQWHDVVEDAQDVVTRVVPTPHHLVLLTESGRVLLYDVMA